MNELIVTVNFSCTLLNADSEQSERIDYGTILSEALMEGKPLDSDKGSLIKEYLEKRNCNQVIGFAIKDLNEYINLKEKLVNCNFNLRKVLFGVWPSSKFEKYEQNFSTHSRWLDYSPEDVKLMTNEELKQYQTLESHLIQDSIEIEHVILS
ncbi:MAG: hypothetical protein EP338_03675 [Bacteroidetes bacterium]|nr:MAG: hypothetical protein EP338_03675 [Bacteroidota bacterium]